MIKFQLVKFDKQILFQVIEHDFPEEFWKDRSHNRNLIVNVHSKHASGTDFYKTVKVWYNGKVEITDGYISLGMDVLRWDLLHLPPQPHVATRHFHSNIDRDISYNLYLKALNAFVKNYEQPDRTIELPADSI